VRRRRRRRLRCMVVARGRRRHGKGLKSLPHLFNPRVTSGQLIWPALQCFLFGPSAIHPPLLHRHHPHVHLTRRRRNRRRGRDRAEGGLPGRRAEPSETLRERGREIFASVLSARASPVGDRRGTCRRVRAACEGGGIGAGIGSVADLGRGGSVTLLLPNPFPRIRSPSVPVSRP
jgi:hypothetical protein